MICLGDGCGLQILAVFPSFVLQQIRNSLAVRRMPKGLETTELIWTAFGFEDDSPKLTEMRLRQAKLVGPAGYVSIRCFRLSDRQRRTCYGQQRVGSGFEGASAVLRRKLVW